METTQQIFPIIPVRFIGNTINRLEIKGASCILDENGISKATIVFDLLNDNGIGLGVMNYMQPIIFEKNELPATMGTKDLLPILIERINSLSDLKIELA